MFKVRWALSARNELAQTWIAADSAMRQAITAASNQIDQSLQWNPQSQGESRGGRDRIWFVFPLAIRFEIIEEKKVVRVLHVWSYVRRP